MKRKTNILLFSIHFNDKFKDNIKTYIKDIKNFIRNNYYEYKVLFVISFSGINIKKDAVNEFECHVQQSSNKLISNFYYYCLDINEPYKNDSINGTLKDMLIDNYLFFKKSIGSKKMNTTYIYVPNKGYDIGKLFIGLMYIEKYWNIDNFDYITFIHTKTNDIWRERLYKVLNMKNEYDDYDSIVSKECYIYFDGTNQNHIINQYVITNLIKNNLINDIHTKKFYFCGGNVFTTKLKNLYKITTNIFNLYMYLTDKDTDDIYWQYCMKNDNIFLNNMKHIRSNLNIYDIHIDVDSSDIVKKNGCKNWIELYEKFNKRGIPDFQTEHALERIIGYWIFYEKNVIFV